MDELEEILEELLSKAYNKILYNEEKILKDMIGDILTQKEFHTLDVIFESSQKGNNTGSKIAKSLGITLSTFTINVDKLIAKGYVTKFKHDDDKRVTYVTLTNEGNAIRNKHITCHKQAIRKAIKNLNQTEKVALLNGISKINFD